MKVKTHLQYQIISITVPYNKVKGKNKIKFKTLERDTAK